MPDGPAIIDSDGASRRGQSIPAGVGFDFRVGTPDMTNIAVSHQTVLEFGEVAVVIESPFELHVDGTTHRLDPSQRKDLGPLLGRYPDAMAELVVSATLEPYEAWQVRGPGDALVVCDAGGEGQLAVWT